MTNPYYNFTSRFIQGTKVKAAEANLQFDALTSAFDSITTVIGSALSNVGTESGAGNVYIVTMSPATTVLTVGEEVVWAATHANTGACTLNVDGLGAKPLVSIDGSALATGAITTGTWYSMRYTGAVWQLMTLGSDAAASATLAHQWAVNPVGVVVSGGEYSAYHWAQTAAAYAAAAGNLNGLIDVTLTATANGNLLMYDSGTSQWINTTALAAASYSMTALRLTSTVDTTLGSTTHGLQIGADAAANLAFSDGNIQSRSNGSAATLNLNLNGGTVAMGADMSATYARLTSTTAVALASTAHGFQIGSTGSTNLRGDNLGIQALNNGGISTLTANALGGQVTIGATTDGTNLVTLQNLQTKVLGRQAAALQVVNSQDGGPVITAAQNVSAELRSSTGLQLASMGFASSTQFTVKSLQQGGVVALAGTTAGGSAENAYAYTPGGAASVYYAGTAHLMTTAAGATISESGVFGTVATMFGQAPSLTLQGANAFLAMDRYNAGGSGTVLGLRTSRSATIGAHTIMQSGDFIGGIDFMPSNGTTFETAARILAWVDGTPGASNDMPARLSFYTTKDGSSSATEIFRIPGGSGAGEIRVAPPSDNNYSYLSWWTAGFVTRKGYTGIQTSQLDFNNEINSGITSFGGRSSGAVDRTMLNMSADGGVNLYYTGTAVFKSTDYNAAGVNSGAQVKDGGATYRDVGFNVMPQTTQNTNYTFTRLDVGTVILHSSTAHTYTTNAQVDASFPVGGTVMIVNGGSAAVALALGASTNLYWLNGSGSIPNAARSLAIGAVVTLYRSTAADWWLFGSGIS